MRGESISRLSELLGSDRRTVAKWIGRAGLEPVSEGPRGPLFELRRVAGVLADADVICASAERQDSWRWLQGQHAGAREAVGRLLDSLAGTLSKRALRQVREAAAELLRRYGLEVDALIGGAEEAPEPSPGPAWAAMPDAELEQQLRILRGGEPDDEEGDPA